MKMIIIYSTEFYLINLLQTNSIFLDSPLYSAYFNKLYFTTYFIFTLIFSCEKSGTHSEKQAVT